MVVSHQSIKQKHNNYSHEVIYNKRHYSILPGKQYTLIGADRVAQSFLI
jgi:hypothetical protein